MIHALLYLRSFFSCSGCSVSSAGARRARTGTGAWRGLGAPGGTPARMLSLASKLPAAPVSNAVVGSVLGWERRDR